MLTLEILQLTTILRPLAAFEEGVHSAAKILDADLLPLSFACCWLVVAEALGLVRNCKLHVLLCLADKSTRVLWDFEYTVESWVRL